MTKVGYARVSTRDQNTDSQYDALIAAGCERIFTDKATVKLASRPELDKCMAYLRAGDVLVITRLARIMRSLKHMIDLADHLRANDIGLVVLKQQIDTTTPSGRLVFHFIAAVDEFQRELIVENTNEGLASARARGRNGGRPSKTDQRKRRRIQELYDAKTMTVQEIADTFSISRQTVYRILEERSVAGAEQVGQVPE
jgi:DNA invertase Pin-like site-specific DNA recombinase